MYKRQGKNPLAKVKRDSGDVAVAKSARQRKLHKAFLRYHDPANWPLLRDALREMGREDLIGNSPDQLIPAYQPRDNGYQSPRRKNSTPATGTRKQRRKSASRNQPTDEARSPRRGSSGKSKPGKGKILTQHTGLPPREQR